MILTPLVKRRLRKVAQRIRRNPSHFNMAMCWRMISFWMILAMR